MHEIEDRLQLLVVVVLQYLCKPFTNRAEHVLAVGDAFAALQRCGNRIVLVSALAAEGRAQAGILEAIASAGTSASLIHSQTRRPRSLLRLRASP